MLRAWSLEHRRHTQARTSSQNGYAMAATAIIDTVAERFRGSSAIAVSRTRPAMCASSSENRRSSYHTGKPKCSKVACLCGVSKISSTSRQSSFPASKRAVARSPRVCMNSGESTNSDRARCPSSRSSRRGPGAELPAPEPQPPRLADAGGRSPRTVSLLASGQAWRVLCAALLLDALHEIRQRAQLQPLGDDDHRVQPGGA